MSGQYRAATFSTTTTYQNVSTLLAQGTYSTFGNNRSFVDILWRVAVDGAFPVRISTSSPGATAATVSDLTSQLIGVGEYLPMSNSNLELVWVKSIGGTSLLEFGGTEGPDAPQQAQ